MRAWLFSFPLPIISLFNLNIGSFLFIFEEIELNMKYLLNLLLLFAIIGHCQAQKIKPALNLKKYNTYYLAGNAKSAITQILNGEANSFNVEVTYKMAFKVTDVFDTVYNMEVSYQSISLKLEGGGVIAEMDSKKNDPQDIPSSIIAAITNKPFKIAITKNGKVISVGNIEKIITGVFDSFPQIDTAKKEQVKSQLLKFLGPGAIKGSIETETAIFPDKAVAENDKWLINTTLESPAKTNINMTYQLVSTMGNYYQIYGEGTMVTSKDANPIQVNGLSIKYDLNGTTISDITVDKATGWISNVKSKQAMKGSMQIPDGPQIPGGMAIPITVSTDIITTDK